ncbi:MAG: DUF6916 family protein [Methylomicrobium sp.]
MLENLTKEDWLSYLGDVFVLSAEPDKSLELTLMDVSGFGRRHGAVREAYSLHFRGPITPVLQQSIFGVSHREMGELEIFLVPIGKDADGVQYEAIFT